MDVGTQKLVLARVIQFRRVSAVGMLSEDVFDLDTHKAIFRLLRAYVKRHGSVFTPRIAGGVFVDEAAPLRVCYDELVGIDLGDDTSFIDASIIQYAQHRTFRSLLGKSADVLSKKEVDNTYLRKFSEQVADITELDFTTSVRSDRQLLLREFVGLPEKREDVTPTQFEAFNKSLGSGGFYSPQILCFAGPPKAFKTGLLINLALHFVMTGKNVYYADTENGEDQIKLRFYQALFNCTRNDLYKQTHVKDASEHLRIAQGDICIAHYSPHQHTLGDLDKDLEVLDSEKNWRPDVIIYDYLDLFRSEDLRKDKRLVIQENYQRSVGLHNKWGCFGLTASHVNRQAVSKFRLSVKDLAEDYGKAGNAHGIFAMLRDPREQKVGLARLIPIVQRDGLSQLNAPFCFLSIRESHMEITEITRKEWAEKIGTAKADPEEQEADKTKEDAAD